MRIAARDRLPARTIWRRACTGAKSRTIGIISNDSFGRFTFPIVEALEERLAEEGIAVFMCNATDDPERERQHLDQLMGKRIDGLVVTARRADKRPPIGPLAHGLPIVYVFSQADDPWRACRCCPTTRAARCWRSRISPRWAESASPISPGPSISRPCSLRRQRLSGSARRQPACREIEGFYLLRASGRRHWGREAVADYFAGRPSAGRDLLRQRPDRARRVRRAARAELAVPGRCRHRRLRQLGRHDARGAAAAHQHRHEPRRRLAARRATSLLDMIAGEALTGVRRRPCSLVVRESSTAVSTPTLQRCERDFAWARFKPVRFVDVALEGQFWRERLETVLTRTIPSQQRAARQARHSGIADAPATRRRRCASPATSTTSPCRCSGIPMSAKWIEAASYALSHRRDADIEARIETITDDLEKAQAPDGYLNCWYLQREPDKRWTNLRDNHELYNLGHLLEGGIAYFLATGRRRLLDILERYVEHVRQTFGPNPARSAAIAATRRSSWR